MSVRWVAPASGDGSASSGRAEEPATAAGRTLWEGYQAVVAKRPDVDGILWLKAITDIEAEAAEDAVDHFILSEAVERYKNVDWRKEFKLLAPPVEEATP